MIGRDARRGRRAHRRHRRAPQPRQLPVGLGPGRQHPVQVVQAEHPRGRGPRPPHRALARRIADGGEVRDQFHHVNDIAPTIYDVLGITAPDVYRGSSSSRSAARRCATPSTPPAAPTTKGVQYYEMFGHRAIIADGWKAVTRHARASRSTTTSGSSTTTTQDRSECHDLAASMPDKLAELVALWWARGRGPGRPAPRRPVASSCSSPGTATVGPPDRRHYTYLPAHGPAAGPGRHRRWAAAASTWRPPSTGRRGQGGVLFATGTENSGISFFVQDDRLVFDYNCFNDHTVLESDVEVPEGPSVVAVDFRRAGAGCRRPAARRRGPRAAGPSVPFAMHIISSVGPSIGYDHGSPVSGRYTGPLPVRGHPAQGRRRRGPQGRRPRTEPRVASSAPPCPSSRARHCGAGGLRR